MRYFSKATPIKINPNIILAPTSVFLTFFSVTKQRNEVIIEGTYNTTLGKNGELADWEEFEFNCKPGDIYRRPCVISPYHYRLDWLMWFAAFQVMIIM